MPLNRVFKKLKLYELGIAQMRASRAISNFQQRTLRQYGLRTSLEWLVMGMVEQASKNGGIRVTDLANEFGVKTTYITAVLNGLKQKGLVSARIDKKDARVRRIVTTAKGSKQVSLIEKHFTKEAVERLNDKVTPEQLTHYFEVLAVIAECENQPEFATVR